MKKIKEEGKNKGICPTCGSWMAEEDFFPSFRYATLIECPMCIKKVKPNNVAKISNVLSDI